MPILYISVPVLPPIPTLPSFSCRLDNSITSIERPRIVRGDSQALRGLATSEDTIKQTNTSKSNEANRVHAKGNVDGKIRVHRPRQVYRSPREAGPKLPNPSCELLSHDPPEQNQPRFLGGNSINQSSRSISVHETTRSPKPHRVLEPTSRASRRRVNTIGAIAKPVHKLRQVSDDPKLESRSDCEADGPLMMVSFKCLGVPPPRLRVPIFSAAFAKQLLRYAEDWVVSLPTFGFLRDRDRHHSEIKKVGKKGSIMRTVKGFFDNLVQLKSVSIIKFAKRFSRWKVQPFRRFLGNF